MSDNSSDKKYKITLTEKQLDLIGQAVEIMFRTGMGQMRDLAEWLVLLGHAYPSVSTEFNIYIAQCDLVEGVLEGISNNIMGFSYSKGESNSLQEIKTLYEVFGHQQWEDSGKPDWDVRADEPIQFGDEPIPKIERIDQ